MSTHFKYLLKMLADGKFHSGEQLGQQLGLTRAAVWKLIKQFADWDLTVESVTNKGYRIPNGLELLDAKKIKKQLNKTALEKLDQVEILDKTNSTNDYLMQLATQHQQQTIACFAEKQTAGKGRRGRQWVSPFASNIYFSLLWHFSRNLHELAGLSLISAIAVVETLKQYGIEKDLQLKWPNDVLWQKQKCAGILIEICGEANDVLSAVIGIGLNISMPLSHSKKINRPWTDVEQMHGKKPDRNQLAGILLQQLITHLISFEKTGLRPFIDYWHTLDISLGNKVTLELPHEKITGISQGIDSHGCFILKDEQGQLHTFSNGEISLRF